MFYFESIWTQRKSWHNCTVDTRIHTINRLVATVALPQVYPFIHLSIPHLISFLLDELLSTFQISVVSHLGWWWLEEQWTVNPLQPWWKYKWPHFIGQSWWLLGLGSTFRMHLNKDRRIVLAGCRQQAEMSQGPAKSRKVVSTCLHSFEWEPLFCFWRKKGRFGREDNVEAGGSSNPSLFHRFWVPNGEMG